MFGWAEPKRPQDAQSALTNLVFLFGVVLIKILATMYDHVCSLVFCFARMYASNCTFLIAELMRLCVGLA